jgi:cell division protein FtsB
MKKNNIDYLVAREKELRAKIHDEEEKLEKLSTERKKIEARGRLDKETSEVYDRYYLAVGRKNI